MINLLTKSRWAFQKDSPENEHRQTERSAEEKYMEYERQRAYDILLGEERGASKKSDEAAIALLKLNKLS